MELQVTKNTYKRANCELILSKNLSKIEAFGYDWFKYVATDQVGNILLSEYSSVTSGQHIGEILAVLRGHSLSPVLYLDFCNQYSETENRSIKALHDLGHYGQNLKDPKRAINSEIKLIKDHIKFLIDKIREPRTHKKKNQARKNEIKNCLYKIKDLRYFRDFILDKKQIKPSFENRYFLGYRHEKLNLNKENVFCEIYGKYLKLNENRAKFYLKNYSISQAQINENDQKGIELNIPKICRLFDLNKNFDFSKIVFYRHIVDLENSIPENVESIQYADFLKVVKRLKITKENLNTLQLDRLHTSLINKSLRAEKSDTPKTPKIWPAYNVNEKLIKLETILNKEKELIKVIKNQGELKSEGRKQKHCIGQNEMGYHSKILTKNYQALNYKGYTFFLNPDLSINEAHGKHNQPTPHEIKNELINLIEGV